MNGIYIFTIIQRREWSWINDLNIIHRDAFCFPVKYDNITRRQWCVDFDHISIQFKTHSCWWTRIHCDKKFRICFRTSLINHTWLKRSSLWNKVCGFRIFKLWMRIDACECQSNIWNPCHIIIFPIEFQTCASCGSFSYNSIDDDSQFSFRFWCLIFYFINQVVECVRCVRFHRQKQLNLFFPIIFS